MATSVLLVNRDRPELYAYLAGRLSGAGDVEVLMDRRRGERRWRSGQPQTERRQGDRRRLDPGADLIAHGIAVTRRDPISARAETRAQPAGFAWPHPARRPATVTPAAQATALSLESRSQAAEWVEAGRMLLATVRDRLEELERRLQSDERESERLRREIHILWTQNQGFRRERGEIADRLGLLVNFPLLNQVLQQLRNGAAEEPVSGKPMLS